MYKLIVCLIILSFAYKNNVSAEEVFIINVEEEGYYNIMVNYAAEPGFGEVTRLVRVGEQEEIITFRRTFVDEHDQWRNQVRNQVRPAQIELQRFVDFVLEVATAQPISFWLNAGANEIEFIELEGGLVFSRPPIAILTSPLISYNEYAQIHSGARRNPNGMITIQAQDAIYRSSATLFPVNDRTCPLVYPFHPSYIRINTIGGNVWRVPGERIEWEVDVPESGLYRVALRYVQREKRGVTSRALLINGEIPFEEAANIRFDYGPHYTSRFLGNDDEYFWFYFESGRNIIALEATLGDFYNIIQDATASMLNLSSIYQDIVMVTGSAPDRYRDYQILTHISDLQPRLRAEAAAIENIIERIVNSGQSFAASSIMLERLVRNINNLADSPFMVAIYLGDFHSSITALGLFITQSMEQPLQIDVLGLAGETAKPFPGRAGFLARVWHRIRALVGSFIVDFNFESESQGEVEQHIEVWISTGFDLFNILGRLVNDSFIRENPNISVDLRLVDSGIIFPASLTGRGPDVVLQTQAITPINFAHRGGAVDLKQFPDFNEIVARFTPAAMDTFEFEGAVYALPDQMTFNVMFYRTDVFEDLGINEVPNTLQEFISLLPNFHTNQMDIFFSSGGVATLGSSAGLGGASIGLNPVHVGILHQMGGSVFNPTGAYTTLASEIGVEAFRFWTNLYTQHNFIVETDVLTRFRMGTLPVVVSDIGLVNLLNATAPELRGRWSIAPVPGLYNSQGEFRRDTVISVSSNFIVRNMVEQRGNIDAAWEFLKWFTSDAVQESFAVEAEAYWGNNWRYLSANINTFERLGWGRDLWPVLQESLDWTIAIPQVPGGYIAGREVRNAFLGVVTDNKNPIDAIFLARDQINNELTIKRREFGLE